jgi:hypothetical protein
LWWTTFRIGVIPHGPPQTPDSTGAVPPTMEGFSQKLLQKGHNRKFLSYTQPDTPAAALFIFHVIETG